MQIDLYTQTGEKKGNLELPSEFFEAKVNQGLIHLALLRQQANARQSNAHTKTRGERQGSTRKLYRQKGTGNARAGSSRSPTRRKGGVAFGPLNIKNYNKDMPKKERCAALKSLLTVKAKENNIFALENYTVEKPKTKDFAGLLKKLPAARSILLVLDKHNENLEFSSKNIPKVKILLVNYLNPFDLLKYEKIMFLKEAIARIPEVFGNKKKSLVSKVVSE